MNSTKSSALLLIAALLAGCASAPEPAEPPEPLEVSDVQELEATVTAVDADSRMVVLRGPAGDEAAFRVGPDVRNLGQVEVGDILRISYYTGFVYSMAEPGTAGADTTIAAGRAEEGDRPGAMVGATTHQTVEILSVAPDGKAVSFRDANGHIQSIDVPREEGQAFARKLRQGDLVDIQYTEAVAIGIVPAESDN